MSGQVEGSNVRLPRLSGRLATRGERLAARPKVTLPFYKTPEWKRLVAQLVKLRGRRCEDCGREGCRVYADHVQELRDGGAALDPGNIRLRCASCHGIKTERERKRRAGLGIGESA